MGQKMIENLWFLKQDDDIVGVFDDYEIAVEEKNYLKEETSRHSVTLHKEIISKLVKNTEEYDMAQERGYLDGSNM
ncbi:MAG: hypothetical protein JEY91_01455 [Spirochaetaceae bacterium]|nr:hypothetical protein [Spirochaetaceae bacterium]